MVQMFMMYMPHCKKDEHETTPIGIKLAETCLNTHYEELCSVTSKNECTKVLNSSKLHLHSVQSWHRYYTKLFGIVSMVTDWMK